MVSFIRKSCFLAVVALTAASVGLSYAQDEKGKGGGQEKKERRRGGQGGGGGGGGGRGGFGGGRGGFGGGMMAGPPMQLLDNENVQKELKLTDDEKAFVKLLADDNRTKIRAYFEENQGQDMQDEAVRTKMQDFFKKQGKETENELKGIIGDERLKRLTQINYQIMGTMSFGSEKVQKELGITKDQQTKLQDVGRQVQEESRETFSNFRDMSQEEQTKALKDMRAKGSEKALAVLTDAQKKKWEELQGTKIAFEIDPFGGFGRGRGGMGGGGNGQGGARRNRGDKQGDKQGEKKGEGAKKPPVA